MVSWRILRWYLEFVGKVCTDRLPTLWLRVLNVCWPWSVESRAAPSCHLFPADRSTVWFTDTASLGGPRLPNAWPEEKQHDLRSIFLNHRLEQRYLTKAQSIPVLYLLILMTFTSWERVFRESAVKSKQTQPTSAGVPYNQTELHRAPSPNPWSGYSTHEGNPLGASSRTNSHKMWVCTWQFHRHSSLRWVYQLPRQTWNLKQGNH